MMVVALILPGSVVASHLSGQSDSVNDAEAGPEQGGLVFMSQFGGSVTAIAIQGNYAYLGVGPRLVVMDISAPASPVLIGQSQVLAGWINAIAISGHYAYVADGNLDIFDISAPATPRLAGSYSSPDSIIDVTLSGSRAYIIDRQLHILDITAPSVPRQIGIYNLPDEKRPTSIAVSGNYVFMTLWWDLMRVIDISNPAAPACVSSYYPGGPNTGVTVAGNYAFISDSSALHIVNISTVFLMTLANKYSFESQGGAPGKVTVIGDTAYVPIQSGLSILNISVPTSPVEKGFYKAPSASRSAVTGKYAFVARGGLGLSIADLSNLSSPAEVFSYRPPGDANSVRLKGRYAYIADGAGLHILDVLHPSKPVQTGFWNQNEEMAAAINLEVAGNYAYVADGNGELRIVDISNPASPFQARYQSTQGYAWDVALSGNYAYATNWSLFSSGNGSLQVINISSPLSSRQVGNLPLQGNVRSLAISGTRAYVTNDALCDASCPGGMHIIDVSNPISPTQLSFFPVYDRGTSDVAVAGHYAFLADDDYANGGLHVLDVQNPKAPVEIAFYPQPCADVAVSVSYAYILENDLWVLDISNPANPKQVGYIDLPVGWSNPAQTSSLTVDGQFIYIAYRDLGLFVYWSMFGNPNAVYLPLVSHLSHQ
ncbi:MAG: LVIVD repeat-containing protein, partial [Omnitrophica WOR_2 bacterium]